MKMGVRLRSGGQSPVSLPHVVLDAEHAGLDFVHIADDPRLLIEGVNHASSTWPALGAMAVATRFVQVRIDGIPITGPLHPAAVAHLTTSAAALLRNRFSVGFAAGSCHPITGLARPERPVRLRALAEGVDVFRRLVAGERVDQQDVGLVVNDLRLPGGLAKVPPVSITATEATEAELAAELGCHLVVPLGADLARVIEAYRNAGGSGDVAAALLLADPEPDASLETARILLTDRAALEDRRSAGRDDADPVLTDDEVMAGCVDATQPDEMTSAVRRLAELGVVQIELTSPSRDPHLAIRQWREYRELIDLPVRRSGEVAEPGTSVDRPLVAAEPAAAAVDVTEPAIIATSPVVATEPAAAAAVEPDAEAETQPVDDGEPDAEAETQPVDDGEPDATAETQPVDDGEPDAAAESDGEAETQPVDESTAEPPDKSQLRSALEVALADHEARDEALLESTDSLKS